MAESAWARPRRPSTFRTLLLAWVVVAAVIVVAFVLHSDQGGAPPPVAARYERQTGARGVHALAPSVAPLGTASALVAPVATAEGAAAITTAVPREDASGTARIFGRITARETGEAVPGVLLGLRNESWDYWDARADQAGEYSLPSLPAGSFTLMVRPDDEDVVTETLADGLTLAAGQERRLDLVVSRAGRVWGTVTDPAGRPIPNARLLLGTGENLVSQFATAFASQREPLHAETDKQGRYTIRGVPFEREWLVWADADRHAPTLSPPFVLHRTRPEVRVDVTLAAGTTIKGRVVDQNRRPIASAQIVCGPVVTTLLAPVHRAPTVRETKAENDGTFEVEGVPQGDYQVLALKDGYRIELKGTPVYPDGVSSIEGLEIVLHSTTEGDHVVFGRVTDGSGRPVAGADVGLAVLGLESLSMGGTNAVTSDDGSFRFEGVCDSELVLGVEKTGFRRTLETVSADHELHVTLERTSTISGVVQSAAGEAVPSFTVCVVRSLDAGSTNLVAQAASSSARRSFEDPTGRFELEDVEPGRLLLEAAAPGHAPGRIEVLVPRGGSATGVTLVLPAHGATLRGVARTANGTPLSGARVTVTEVEDPRGLLAVAKDGLVDAPSTITDANGAFLFEHLAAARYRIQASAASFAPATVSPVVVKSDESAAVALVFASGGTIEGHARPGAMITVAGDAWSTMLGASETGDFKLEHVPPGTYLLRAVGTNGAALGADVVRQTATVAEGEVTRVTLDADETTGHSVKGQLDPPAKGSMALVLLRVPGSPPPDLAALSFTGVLGARSTETSPYIVAEGLLGKDGSFSLRGVPPGRYVQEVYTTSVLATFSGQRAALRESKEVVVE